MPSVIAVVFTGANGIFSGGADVNDFTTEPGPDTKTIRDVIAAVERGNEDVRCGDRRQRARRRPRALARVRLSRRDPTLEARAARDQTRLLAGRRRHAAPAALDRRASRARVHAQGRRRIAADEAKELGMLDEVVDGDVRRGRAGAGRRQGGVAAQAPRLGAQSDRSPTAFTLQAAPFVVSQAHKMVPPEDSGGFAAHKLIDAVEAAVEMPFAFGIAREARLFDELVRSEAVARAAPRLLRRARTRARFPACRRPSRSRSKGRRRRRRHDGHRHRDYVRASRHPGHGRGSERRRGRQGANRWSSACSCTKCRRAGSRRKRRGSAASRFTFTDDSTELADADVVVEAVFENMDVKKEVFAKLDGVVKPEAHPRDEYVDARHRRDGGGDEASRASSSACTSSCRPTSCRCSKSCAARRPRRKRSRPRSSSARRCARRRCSRPTRSASSATGWSSTTLREAARLAEEGVSPARVDAVMKDFGLPMGPFAMCDLSGLDVAWHIAKARARRSRSAARSVVDRLVEMKRLGQKTMAGYFKYDKSRRQRPRADSPIPTSKRSSPKRRARRASRRATSPTRRFASACSYALINAARICSKRASRCAPATSTSSTSTATDSRRITAARCGTPTKSACKHVLRSRASEFGWEPAPLLEEIAAKRRHVRYAYGKARSSFMREAVNRLGGAHADRARVPRRVQSNPRRDDGRARRQARHRARRRRSGRSRGRHPRLRACPKARPATTSAAPRRCARAVR